MINHSSNTPFTGHLLKSTPFGMDWFLDMSGTVFLGFSPKIDKHGGYHPWQCWWGHRQTHPKHSTPPSNSQDPFFVHNSLLLVTERNSKLTDNKLSIQCLSKLTHPHAFRKMHNLISGWVPLSRRGTSAWFYLWFGLRDNLQKTLVFTMIHEDFLRQFLEPSLPKHSHTKPTVWSPFFL